MRIWCLCLSSCGLCATFQLIIIRCWLSASRFLAFTAGISFLSFRGWYISCTRLVYPMLVCVLSNTLFRATPSITQLYVSTHPKACRALRNTFKFELTRRYDEKCILPLSISQDICGKCSLDWKYEKFIETTTPRTRQTEMRFLVKCKSGS